jgi:hypothetical protein
MRRRLKELGFAIYRASHNDYEDSIVPADYPAGTPKKSSTAQPGFTGPTLRPG